MRALFLLIILFIAFSSFSQIPTNGLFAYYPFTGNANDQSGNGYNGTLNGPMLTIDRFNQINSAYFFDGVNDFIDFNSYTSPFNFQQPASISFWVKTASDNAQTIYTVEDGTVGNHYSCIYIGNNTTGTLTNPLITVAHEISTSDRYISGFTTTQRGLLIDNKWHHIVIIFDGISTQIYLDNLLRSVTTGWGTNNGHYGNMSDPGKVLLGVYYDSGYQAYLNGSLDDIRIYNRVLTPSEVDVIYHETPCTASIPVVNDTAICGGGVVTLNASGGTNYIWYNSSGNQIASGPFFTTPFLMNSTSYFITNFDGVCESLRDTVNIIVHLLPSISFSPLGGFVNIYNTSVFLYASPSGGTFSGDGVSGSIFYPSVAGLGSIYINYFYTDPYGCSNSALQNVIVYDTLGTTCIDTIYISVTDTLIIDVLLSLAPPDNINTIKIYPNPTQDFIIINTGNYFNMSDYTIKIENNLGQTIFQNLANQQIFQININDFGGYGIYFVKIIDNTGNVLTTRKIILE